MITKLYSELTGAIFDLYTLLGAIAFILVLSIIMITSSSDKNS